MKKEVTNYKLLAEMQRWGISVEELAKVINKSRVSIGKKIKNNTFNQNELKLIYRYLKEINTELTTDIFF